MSLYLTLMEKNITNQLHNISSSLVQQQIQKLKCSVEEGGRHISLGDSEVQHFS